MSARHTQRIQALRDLAQARELVADGVDPGEAKKQRRAAQIAKDENTFENIAREWFKKFEPKWVKSHSVKILSRMERDLFPRIGARPIAEIQPIELLRVLQRVEARGRLETAHRVNQNCGQIFRYAVATDRAPRDVSRDLRGALAPWRSKHYASIRDPKAIGELLRARPSTAHACATGLRSASPRSDRRNTAARTARPCGPAPAADRWDSVAR